MLTLSDIPVPRPKPGTEAPAQTPSVILDGIGEAIGGVFGRLGEAASRAGEVLIDAWSLDAVGDILGFPPSEHGRTAVDQTPAPNFGGQPAIAIGGQAVPVVPVLLLGAAAVGIFLVLRK